MENKESDVKIFKINNFHRFVFFKIFVLSPFYYKVNRNISDQ
jgi:hypothetical protein